MKEFIIYYFKKGISLLKNTSAFLWECRETVGLVVVLLAVTIGIFSWYRSEKIKIAGQENIAEVFEANISSAAVETAKTITKTAGKLTSSSKKQKKEDSVPIKITPPPVKPPPSPPVQPPQKIIHKPDFNKPPENNPPPSHPPPPEPEEPPIETPPELPPPPQDTTAPTVTFDALEAIQRTIAFTIRFTITDADEFTSGSDVSSYVFRWQNESNGWQEHAEQQIADPSPTFSGAIEFEGIDGNNYYFQIKAKDSAGNQSEWLPITPATTKIEIPQNIVINEIHTYGQSSTDQFVELYNPNSTAFDLTGFSLKKKTSTGTESNLVSSGAFLGTISANGFFLIISQAYTGSVAADLHYSGSSFSLAQKDNAVLLYDAAGAVVDQVAFGTVAGADSSFMCPGETQCIPKTKSIERKSLGTDTNNNSEDFQVLEVPTPHNSAQ